MSAAKSGDTVKVPYTGTIQDGTYERIHQDSLESIASLITAYAQSPPLYPRDRFELGPRTGFPTMPG